MPIRGDGMHRVNCIDWLAWRSAEVQLMDASPAVFAEWERVRKRSEYFEWLNTFRAAWPDMWEVGAPVRATRAAVYQRVEELWPEVWAHYSARLAKEGEGK